MLKAKLGNEFGDPASKGYKAREAAFNAYNSLVEKVPETVASVMARLALNETIDKDDRLGSAIEHAALTILDVTNHGTQIGIAPPAREATWAEIFDDDAHRKASNEYAAFKDNSPEAIAACRRRGLETLKVIARTHIDAGSEQENLSTHVPRSVAA